MSKTTHVTELITEVNRLAAKCDSLQARNALLEAVAKAAEKITGEHDSDCESVVEVATARWLPECDCSMQDLKDALSQLEASE